MLEKLFETCFLSEKVFYFVIIFLLYNFKKHKNKKLRKLNLRKYYSFSSIPFHCKHLGISHANPYGHNINNNLKKIKKIHYYSKNFLRQDGEAMEKDIHAPAGI